MKISLKERIIGAVKNAVNLTKVGIGMGAKGLSPIESVKKEAEAVKDSVGPLSFKEAVKNMPSLTEAVKEEVQDVMESELLQTFKGMRQGYKSVKTAEAKDKFIETISDSILEVYYQDNPGILKRKPDIGTKEGLAAYIEESKNRQERLREEFEQMQEARYQQIKRTGRPVEYISRQDLLGEARNNIAERIRPDYRGVWASDPSLIPSDRLTFEQAAYFAQEQTLLVWAKKFQEKSAIEKAMLMQVAELQLQQAQAQADAARKASVEPVEIILTLDNYKNFQMARQQADNPALSALAQRFIEALADKFSDVEGIDELVECYQMAPENVRAEFMSIYRDELDEKYNTYEAETNESRQALINEALTTIKNKMGIGKPVSEMPKNN